MRKPTSRCPNGCNHRFQRVKMSSEHHDQFLCDVCGEEVVFEMPEAIWCKCGSRDFTIRPHSGQSIEKGYLMRCAICGEYVTLDSLISLDYSYVDRKRRIRLLLLVLFVIIAILVYGVWMLIRS